MHSQQVSVCTCFFCQPISSQRHSLSINTKIHIITFCWPLFLFPDQISTSSIPTYPRVRSRSSRPPIIFEGHSDMRGYSRSILGLRMRDLQLMTGLLLLAV